MSRQRLIALYLLALIILGITAQFQHSPGYMDADYYLMGGVQLARGNGFQDWVLWNYLEPPQDLPHPSHRYWMPAVSVLSAGGILLFPFLEPFRAAQVLFLAIAAVIPLITAQLAWNFTARRDHAWRAGILACFPVFYLPYLTTTDSFSLFMILGSIGLWLLSMSLAPETRRTQIYWLGFGAIVGSMHLVRSDGFTWLGIGWAAAIMWSLRTHRWGKDFLIHLLLPLLGYLFILSPWFFHNISSHGSLLAPGSLSLLWMTSYDELFVYPASSLSFSNWWGSGLTEILRVRLWALGQNMQTAVAVQGLIFASPLMVWGFWASRRRPVVLLAALGWAGTLFVMTILFPFVGARGGFFHSGAAFQPFLWVMAFLGLDEFVMWGQRVRGWRPKQAARVFGGALIFFAALITLFIAWQRVVGSSITAPVWDAGVGHYQSIDRFLTERGASPDDRVMVNNPPGYYLASNRTAVVIPYGHPGILLEVAERYQIRFIILEHNHPSQLAYLYMNPSQLPELNWLDTLEGTHILEIRP